ncbi:zinc-dependent peptidase [Mucilaginibacter sp.]|uniref:M90 family metallopeptidase n=1 Tax=Mucilaginibacter sp. TaxID=1882438 RepID=UPI002628374A|nr:M90 family metallopeptidase [Mucilaginibacter sp.]MDB4918662.1 zinc-dependent peptidase [Mucilaginibacter sp.]
MIIAFIILLIIIAAFFVFRKNNNIVRTDEEPGINYYELLDTQVSFYHKLNLEGKARFEKRIREFFKEVRIEGVGTVITDLDRLLIASSAVIPIFGFPDWKYHNLTNVILYPDTFDQEFQFEGENRNILGMVGSGYMNGQMLLSRAALIKGFSQNAGTENAAIHEFVHLLDKSDGATDGIPENLMAHPYIIPWLHMVRQEMHRIQSGESDINPYALTNEAEFFAVVAEYFFEKPEQLQHKHPELYQQLSQIFGQNPAGS